jgi:Cof subfamily protein (haloacid dehalogenase superfamily)
MVGSATPAIKAVFVDLDDTFLAPDKSIPEANLALMDQLAERGIELVPCSGRHALGVPKEMREHPSVHYVITSNGGAIHSLDEDRDIFVCDISHEMVEAMYERLSPLPIIFDAFANDHAYSEQARKHLFDQIDVPEGLRAYLKAGRTFVDTTIPELLPSLGPVTKLSLFFVDSVGADAIDKAVRELGGMHYVQTSASNYEVMNEHATKGAALTWLAQHMGWDISQTVAFGDNNNDVTMLEAAGDGVAMQNGTESAKVAANHIAPPAKDGGVAQYMQALL